MQRTITFKLGYRGILNVGTPKTVKDASWLIVMMKK